MPNSSDDPTIGAMFTNAQQIRQFAIGGKATLTIVGKDHRYTFKVDKAEPTGHYTTAAYFLSMLTGADNTSDYSYVGLLDCATGRIRLTRKSRMNEESTPVKAWNWYMAIVWAGRMPTAGQCWHIGRCGRCGRALTVPASIASGFGPECSARMNGGE